MQYSTSLLVLALLTVDFVAGCSQESSGVDPRWAVQRENLLLDHEPDGAVGVLDAREMIPHAGKLVIVGRIGGVDDPWGRDEASFAIADPSWAPDDHATHEDCGDDCPFCSAKEDSANDAVALVQVVDEAGKVLPVDARALLGVDTDQMVVVLGDAEVNSLGLLVVSAQGIYVRR